MDTPRELHPSARQGGITLPATFQGVASTKTGAVSAVFHIPFEDADEAFKLHQWHHKPVVLTVSEDE